MKRQHECYGKFNVSMRVRVLVRVRVRVRLRMRMRVHVRMHLRVHVCVPPGCRTDVRMKNFDTTERSNDRASN